ncbi:MAG TPA: peptidoglycan recognition family protein [Candidatus Binatia bacterium]|nr:peptidoglycan recognition family protein [Candidatus Binatia bacterium]
MKAVLLIAMVAAAMAVPNASYAAAKPAKSLPDPDLPVKTEKTLTAIPVRGSWKHIVIHHTATPAATPRGIDRFHREQRHMENGMAYHFLIGNGHGMGDGEIYIGERWKRQIQGGHLASEQLNMSSIGICLVGNFESKPPTDRQMKSLEALLRKLRQQTGLTMAAVTTHRSIHPRHTSCPGKYFALPKNG